MKEEETIEFWKLHLEFSFADGPKDAPLFLCLSKNILGQSENSLRLACSQIDLD